jgi:hypothetical protein
VTIPFFVYFLFFLTRAFAKMLLGENSKDVGVSSVTTSSIFTSSFLESKIDW